MTSYFTRKGLLSAMAVATFAAGLSAAPVRIDLSEDGIALVSQTAEARRGRGADDAPGHKRRGRGSDDVPGHNHPPGHK